MRKAGGYAQFIDPDAPLGEYDTIACGHCNRIVFTKPNTLSTTYLIQRVIAGVFRWVEEPGAGCRCCMKPVCLSCYDLGSCTPFEKWLDQKEKPMPVIATAVGARALILSLLLLVGLAGSAAAQPPPPQIISVGSFPASLGVQWDELNPSTVRILAYQVFLDGVANGAKVTEKQANVLVGSPGQHFLTIRGFTATESTPDSVALVFQTVLAVVLLPPANLRVNTLVATSFAEGVDVRDQQGHRWTLDADGHTLKDGVWAGAGVASTYLTLPSGLYCLGTTANWYRWDDPTATWNMLGPTKPTN